MQNKCKAEKVTLANIYRKSKNTTPTSYPAITSVQQATSIIPTTPHNNRYIIAATSDNTRKAYQANIRHYENWGGPLPASTDNILSYLQNFAETLNPRTLSRRLAALKQRHRYQQFADPTESPMVTKTLTGIMRLHGKPKEKAAPLRSQSNFRQPFSTPSFL